MEIRIVKKCQRQCLEIHQLKTIGTRSISQSRTEGFQKHPPETHLVQLKHRKKVGKFIVISRNNYVQIRSHLNSTRKMTS